FIMRGCCLLSQRRDDPHCLLKLAFAQANLAYKSMQMPNQRQQYFAQTRILRAGNGLEDRVSNHGLIFYDHSKRHEFLRRRLRPRASQIWPIKRLALTSMASS